jgi:hypothetical protein
LPVLALHVISGETLDEVAVARLLARGCWHALTVTEFGVDGSYSLLVGFADRRGGTDRVIAHAVELPDR